MMTRTLVSVAGLCLVCAAGVPVSRTDLPALGASQDDRPRFFGKQIVDSINVVDPENALGESDGRFAEIRPGGEMAILMANPIHYSDALEDGAVVTKGDGQYGLAALFRMNEEGQSAWQPLAPGLTPGGFKFGPSKFIIAQSTETLRIANDDTRPIFVDAVFGYGNDERDR